MSRPYASIHELREQRGWIECEGDPRTEHRINIPVFGHFLTIHDRMKAEGAEEADLEEMTQAAMHQAGYPLSAIEDITIVQAMAFQLYRWLRALGDSSGVQVERR